MYDLAIIGAGWAGFSAVIKAKEAGLKVILIEKDKLGGTCLNSGCIPTKALIQSAKVFSLIKKSSRFGIELDNPRINLSSIQERKERIIQQLKKGMELILKGVEFVNSPAELISPDQIKINDRKIEARFILLATGSKPMELPNLKFDHKKIISSDDILNLKDIPNSLLIIGGGIIGCEFASLFSFLGTTVSIVELMPQLLPGQDYEVAKKLEVIFKKRGIKINTNTDATKVNLLDYDLVLLCIGRIPNIHNLGLEKIGIKLEKNKIFVDDYLRTSIANIYAAGDCTGKIMLAHFASFQGTKAVYNIINSCNPKKVEKSSIPNCIFTEPEIASVGITEQIAQEKNLEIKINKFDFLGSGMAHILDETEGFVKVISDIKTDRILGASIIGPKATELISIFTLAIESQLTTNQIKEIIFAHPTLSEAVSETFKKNYGI
ncbi:MAG: dihydrolipoyl dehydrogenase [Candidatus Omnitrophica bacterium]|nr:dihydrolipoyl dehydrogenase [Candidatus Omnitrophota bacterium]